MALYDAYGRLVEPTLLKEEQAGPTMAGVRNIYSVMHASAGLTPERLTAILGQAEFGDPYTYLELAEEMEEKDLHYLAVIGTRKEAVAQLDIIVRPASTEKHDIRLAEMVSEFVLKGTLNLESAIFDILDAVGKGYSATEIIWDTEGKEWIPQQLKWRDPRWFAFDWVSGEQLYVRTLGNEGASVSAACEKGNGHADAFIRRGGIGGEHGIWNGQQPMTAPLAPFKFVVHFAKAKAGLPIRGGLARAAGWAYLFKNYILKDWVTFAEVFGQPLRLGKYNSGATDSDKQTLLRAVANIGTDAAAIIPDSMVIEFTEARQTGSADLYERFCEYIDQQVSKAVLGQTLTTDVPRGGGSRTAAQVHEGVRHDILAADARRLQATLTRDLVKPIVDLNVGPQRRYPRLQLALPDDQDAKIFTDIITALADRGLRIGQRAVMDKLGLPAPGNDEALLEPAKSFERPA